MNTRERFHAIMHFQPCDRLPLLEWAGWWDKTVARWHGEGLPADKEYAEKAGALSRGVVNPQC